MTFKKNTMSPVHIWGAVITIVLVVTAIFISCMVKKRVIDRPISYSADLYTIWREHGGSPDQLKYTTLNQITIFTFFKKTTR
jgi:hypothetical protein